MIIFENSETKIEIKKRYWLHCFGISHKGVILFFDIDMTDVFRANLDVGRYIKFNGTNGDFLEIIFKKENIVLKDRLVSVVFKVEEKEIEQIQKKFEEFARDWRKLEDDNF